MSGDGCLGEGVTGKVISLNPLSVLSKQLQINVQLHKRFVSQYILQMP